MGYSPVAMDGFSVDRHQKKEQCSEDAVNASVCLIMARTENPLESRGGQLPIARK